MARAMVGRAFLVASGAVALAMPARAQNLRIVQRTPDPRLDSLTERIFKAPAAEVQRIVVEWKEREAQLMRSLEATASSNDLLARRRTEEELARNSRDAFAMMTAIERRCERERLPQPAGYVGVSLDTKVEVIGGRPPIFGEVTVSSVEPGGPAERAGVQRDDRVLSIGGRDASKGIPDISDLLVPGRSLLVRIERAGATRDIPVAVEPRPTGFAESCGDFEKMLMPLRIANFQAMKIRQAGPPPDGVRGVAAGAVEARPRSEQPDEVRVMVFGPGGNGRGSMSYFFGAQFRALDDDWREALGVKQGVMVNEVAAGSLTARAGLKGGDVVIAVGDTPVNDPIALVRALDIENSSEAKLSIVRGKERKVIPLRWGQP